MPQNLLYQGKEWQKDLDLNLYDFVWRQYDPLTARTTGADPHAESYQPMSPYSWVKNNPLGMIDPDGRDAVTYYGKEAVEYIQDLQNQAIAAEQNSEVQSSKNSFSKGFASYRNRQRSDGTDPAEEGGSWTDLTNSIFDSDLYSLAKNFLPHQGEGADTGFRLLAALADGDMQQVKEHGTNALIGAASAIPIGKLAVGASLLWAGSTKVSKSLMAWKVLGGASQGTLVSTALAGRFLHYTIGNPAVSQMTFGL